MGRGGGAFFKAVGLLDGVDRLTLHPFGQGGGDFGERHFGSLGERGVAGQPDLGQTENQRLDLQPW